MIGCFSNLNDYDLLALEGEDTGIDEATVRPCEYIGADLGLRGAGVATIEPDGSLWFHLNRSEFSTTVQVDEGDLKFMEAA